MKEKMRIHKIKKSVQIWMVLMGALGIAAMTVVSGFMTVPVKAASGTVYTCTIHPGYKHPVTGEIEDSGGEASYATGQGMVEGCVSGTGILEETDGGEYFLTIRLSLMDYTSNHSFWVQTWGESGWASPALGITGSGSDSSGTTNDICIQVPSKDCVVRGSMYVEPMGRDVIFYLYPSDYVEGNNTDMTATLVTEASVQGAEASQTEETVSDTSGNAQEEASSNAETEKETEAGEKATVTLTAPSGNEISQNGTNQAAAETSAEEEALNEVQGLSLSTAEEAEIMTEASGGETRGFSVGEQILVNVISATLSGIILIFTTAAVVWLFLKNRYRWFGYPGDDRWKEEEEDEEEED